MYLCSILIPKLIQSTCFEGFTLPRITWTIEPSPNGTNTTSIYTYPPNIGTLKTGDMNKGYCEGFELDMDAIDNTTDEIAILIQTPRDALEYVEVGQGMPFYVNIIDGFTALRSLSVWGASACDYYDGCAQCNTLFTYDDIKDIGPKVVADLSSVDLYKELVVENETVAFTEPLGIRTWGVESIYDLTVILPPNDEGVGVQMMFESANANVYIKGDIKCDNDEEVVPSFFEYTNENYCALRGTDASGCKACSNFLTIDGSISGYFNVSGVVDKGEQYELIVNISEDGGCDHFIWELSQIYHYDSMPAPSTSLVCTDGAEADAVVDTSPLPCIGGIGSVDCGSSPYGYEGCFCKVPFEGSEDYCPSIESGSADMSILMFWTSFAALAVFYLQIVGNLE